MYNYTVTVYKVKLYIYVSFNGIRIVHHITRMGRMGMCKGYKVGIHNIVQDCTLKVIKSGKTTQCVEHMSNVIKIGKNV